MGYATAKHLQAQGHDLVLTARTEESFQRIKKDFPDALHFKVDLTNDEDLNSFLTRLKSKVKKLDVLINNAGEFVESAFAESTLADFDRMYKLDVRAPFMVTKEAVPLLRKANAPIVINMSSVAAVGQYPKVAAYSAAKAALTKITEVARKDLEEDGIRFTVIHPHQVNTWNDKQGDRMLRPDDIAELIGFIINTHPNCQVLRVDVSSIKPVRQE